LVDGGELFESIASLDQAPPMMLSRIAGTNRVFTPGIGRLFARVTKTTVAATRKATVATTATTATGTFR
jgi:hypothetical protein